MSVPVALTNLEEAARERGPAAYIISVGETGTPHVVHAEVIARADGLVARVGGRTVANARARTGVSVLYPARHQDDYSLIVDAVATLEGTGNDLRLRLAPTRAVMHRPEPAPDPSVSPCGSDCIPISLRATQ